MPDILLSVKPEYAEEILEGRKKYEFRKCRPGKGASRVILYAVLPVGKVVGEAAVTEVIEGSPLEIWEMARHGAGISREFFFSYYSGREKAYAWRLGNARRYGEPMPLSDFGVRRAPQSFAYVRDGGREPR